MDQQYTKEEKGEGDEPYIWLGNIVARRCTGGSQKKLNQRVELDWDLKKNFDQRFSFHLWLKLFQAFINYAISMVQFPGLIMQWSPFYIFLTFFPT